MVPATQVVWPLFYRTYDRLSWIATRPSRFRANGRRRRHGPACPLIRDDTAAGEESIWKTSDTRLIPSMDGVWHPCFAVLRQSIADHYRKSICDICSLFYKVFENTLSIRWPALLETRASRLPTTRYAGKPIAVCWQAACRLHTPRSRFHMFKASRIKALFVGSACRPLWEYSSLVNACLHLLIIPYWDV